MNHHKLGRYSLACMASWILFLSTATPWGAAEEFEGLALWRHKQDRAAASARQLVAGVLDRQLQQLRENGLQDRPVFAEITATRNNLDTLVQQDMHDVTRLLRQAEQATDKQRGALLDEARQRIRHIVLSLTDERGRLRRRLGMARLAELVRETIALQDRVLQTTRRLPEHAREMQEREALSAIEDQQDVEVLHKNLQATLKDVASWPGDVAESAAAGLDLLERSHASQDLRAIVEGLRAVRFAEVAERQEKLLRTYRELLEIVRRQSGPTEPKAEEVLADSVADLMERQRRLREQTSETLKDEQRDALVDEQFQLQQDLGKLQDLLPEDEDDKALASRAEAGAMQAATDLFEGKTEAARAKQDQVVGDLTRLQSRIRAAAERTAEGGESPERAADDAIADKGAAGQAAADGSPPAPTPPAPTPPTGQPGAEEGAVANADRPGEPRGESGREDASPAASQGASPAAGRSAGAVAVPPRDAASRPPGGDLASGREDASWFTRLPPDVRQAIRSRVRQRAPRGYEDRLRRYFESVE